MSIAEFIYTVILKPTIFKKSINWIIRKITPTSINIHGATIYLNPNDPVVSGALTFNVFEHQEIAFFKRYFSPTMTLLDIGANVGLYTGLALATKDFQGTIIAMEPHDESHYYLQQTVSANLALSRITQHQIVLSHQAASNQSGTTTLYTNPDNKGDNRVYADPILTTQSKIDTITIDELCDVHRITTVNFIKIDIQGAEENAIRGAIATLQRSKDCILLSELWPWGLAQNNSSCNRYIALLQSQGFDLYQLDNKGNLTVIDSCKICQQYQGRQYTNIVGFKGRYQPT